jgi:hypothetical protein
MEWHPTKRLRKSVINWVGDSDAYVHVSDSEDVSALPSDAHKAVGVIDGGHHDAIVSQQGEEEVLLTLRAPRPYVDAIIPTAGSRSSHIDIEAVTLHKRHTFSGVTMQYKR